MESKSIENIIYKLESYIEKENYKGWDPYDALNSNIVNKITSIHPFFQRVAIHLLKNSPVNLRPQIGIEKDYNPTALSLFIDGYVNLYKISDESIFLRKANKIKDILYNLSCVNTSDEIGWGRNFKYITTKETHELDKPLTFLNAKLTISLLSLYEITREKLILDNAKKAIHSILLHGRIFKTKKGIFVGYSSDNKPRYIFNASILTAELIIKYLYYSNQDDIFLDGISLKKLARDLIDTILEKQQNDGKWYYGYTHDFILLKNVDFHQGFIIDSLFRISKYCKYRKKDVIKAHNLGIEFMYNEQITDDGRFKWRLPKEYPIDIHNQAQGIISLSKKEMNGKYDTKLDSLLKYTIDNFFDFKKGYFYYQKNRLFINKIPFIRWSEGWMFYALTEYLKNRKID